LHFSRESVRSSYLSAIFSLNNNVSQSGIFFLSFVKRRFRNAKEPSFRASDAAHREIRNPEKPNQYDESWIPARALFTGLGRMTNGDAASVLRARPSISASPFRPKMDINSIEKLMGL
jgi:hypothetical protein